MDQAIRNTTLIVLGNTELKRPQDWILENGFPADNTPTKRYNFLQDYSIYHHHQDHSIYARENADNSLGCGSGERKQT